MCEFEYTSKNAFFCASIQILNSTKWQTMIGFNTYFIQFNRLYLKFSFLYFENVVPNLHIFLSGPIWLIVVVCISRINSI